LSKSFRLSEVFEELRAAGKCRLKEVPLDLSKVIKPPEDVEPIAKYLRTVGEPNKPRILFLLKKEPLPVCVISHVLGLNQTLVSHHLGSLTKLGLVETLRIGKFKLYTPSNEACELLGTLLRVVPTLKGQSLVRAHSRHRLSRPLKPFEGFQGLIPRSPQPKRLSMRSSK